MHMYKAKERKYLAVFVLLTFIMSFSVALVVPSATAVESNGGPHQHNGGDTTAEIDVIVTFANPVTAPSIGTVGFSLGGSSYSINLSDGHYKVTGLPAGSYDATDVTLAGYEVQSKSANYGGCGHPQGASTSIPIDIQITADKSDAEIHIILMPSAFSGTLNVTKSFSGNAVTPEQVTFTLQNLSSGSWSTVTPQPTPNVVNNNDGTYTYTYTGLAAGQYRVVEDTAFASKYDSVSYSDSSSGVPINVDHKSNSISVVNTKNTSTFSGTLNVTKSFSGNAACPEQVTFTLQNLVSGNWSNVNPQPTPVVVDNNNGTYTYTYTGLAAGQYRVVEDTAFSNKYVVSYDGSPDNLFGVPVNSDHNSNSISVINTKNITEDPGKGKVIVNKSYPDAPAGTYRSTFELTQYYSGAWGNHTKVFTAVTDSSNQAIFINRPIIDWNLKFDWMFYTGSHNYFPLYGTFSHTLKETKVEKLEGSIWVDVTSSFTSVHFTEQPIIVPPCDELSLSYEVTNNYNSPDFKRTITVHKTDSANNPMNGTFELYVGTQKVDFTSGQNGNATGEWSQEFTINADTLCTIKEVPPAADAGKYYQATLNGSGNILNQVSPTFTLSKSVETPTILNVKNFQNGKITVNKKYDCDTKQPYKDLKCKIKISSTALPAPGYKISDEITGENAAVFDSLPEGLYTVSEVDTPAGFTSTPYSVILGPANATNNATLDSTTDLTNVEQTGSLSINKAVDDDTVASPDLSSFEFSVTDPYGNKIATGRSDSDGHVQFDTSTGLTPKLIVRANLKYTIKETNTTNSSGIEYWSAYATGNGIEIDNVITADQNTCVTVTNKTLPDNSITVVKNWKYGDPVRIVIELLQDGTVVDSHIIEASEGQGATATFSNLKPGTYTISEQYISSSDPYGIIVDNGWRPLGLDGSYTINEAATPGQVVTVTNEHLRTVTVTKDFAGNGWSDVSNLRAVITVNRISQYGTGFMSSVIGGVLPPVYFPVTIALGDGDRWSYDDFLPYTAYEVTEVGIYLLSDLNTTNPNHVTINDNANEQYAGLYSTTITPTADDSYNNGTFAVVNSYSTGGNTPGDHNTPSTNTYTGTTTVTPTVTETAPEQPQQQPQQQQQTVTPSAPIVAEQQAEAIPAAPEALPKTGAESGMGSIMLLASMFASSGLLLRRVGKATNEE